MFKDRQAIFAVARAQAQARTSQGSFTSPGRDVSIKANPFVEAMKENQEKHAKIEEILPSEISKIKHEISYIDTMKNLKNSNIPGKEVMIAELNEAIKKQAELNTSEEIKEIEAGIAKIWTKEDAGQLPKKGGMDSSDNGSRPATPPTDPVLEEPDAKKSVTFKEVLAEEKTSTEIDKEMMEKAVKDGSATASDRIDQRVSPGDTSFTSLFSAPLPSFPDAPSTKGSPDASSTRGSSPLKP